MQTNIQKWGNSLAIRIPNFIAKKLAIQNGDAVELIMNDNQITINTKKISLATMLSQVTEDNIHDNEWENLDIKGKEIW